MRKILEDDWRIHNVNANRGQEVRVTLYLSFQKSEEAAKRPKDEFGQRGGKGRFRRGCWSHKEGGFSRSSPIKK